MSFKLCALLSQIAFLSTVLVSPLVQSAATEDEKRRLNFQNRIDDHALLTDATFAATHNSYHAVNDGYGGSQNHKASIAQQLDAGIQFINLDLRADYVFSPANPPIRMCHGACFEDSRWFTEGLNDIEKHLLENPNKVIFVMLELKVSQANDAYPRILADLNNHSIRSYLYTPEHYDSSYADTQKCRPLPLDKISEADIKSRVGAHNNSALVIMNWHKDDDTNPCPTDNKSLWDKTWAYKFAGPSAASRGGDTWILAAENRGAGEDFQNLFSDLEITATEMTGYMEDVGTHLLALDHIVFEQEGGDRFDRLIWTWAPNQPQPGDDSTKACVVAQFDSNQNAIGWRTENCGNSFYAACKNINESVWGWKATSQPVLVNDAEVACQQFGDEYHFASPVNPQQAKAMRSTIAHISQNILINVRMDNYYRGEHPLQYSVRVGSSHSSDTHFMLDNYQGDLVEQVDILHANLDVAVLNEAGAEARYDEANDNYYDRRWDALMACGYDENYDPVECDDPAWGLYIQASEDRDAAWDLWLYGSDPARTAWADLRVQLWNRSEDETADNGNGGPIEVPPLVEPEIPVENIALYKFASMSSAAYNGNSDAQAINAVDGNLTWGMAHNSIFNAGEWWKVDLGQVYNLHYSEWYNRNDQWGSRMNDYTIQGSLNDIHWFTLSDQNSEMGHPSFIGFDAANAQARYVRLVQNRAEPINFREVEIYGTPVENVALNKNASMKSVPYNNNADAQPGNAIDGNLDWGMAHNSVFNAGEWWQVDLGQVYTLYSSEWFNRLNCCQSRMNDYTIKGSIDGSEWFVISDQNVQMGHPTSIKMNHQQARYIRLVTNKNEPINFREVKIYGIPSANIALGKYATMDSEHGSGLYSASKAVNGKSNAGNDFAHNSHYVAGETWQVDLGAIYRLSYSNWYNRVSCCQYRMNNYTIQGSVDGISWFDLSVQTSQMGHPTSIDFNFAEARYVRLVQHNNEPINFAEVEIFGDLLN